MRKIIVTLGLILTACSSGRTNPKNGGELDIVNNNLGKKDAKNLADPSRPISPEAVFNWQKFFKGPPPESDRRRILSVARIVPLNANVSDLIVNGRNQLSIGMIETAESSFRQALRKEPNNIEALIELAGTLQRQRKIQASFEILAKARDELNQAEAPDSGQIFRYRYTLAMAHLANDEREKAHPILSDLVGKDRTFLPGYAALALSYLKDGKDTIAGFIVNQAIDRGGDHASLYNILGLLAERQGNQAAARAHYNRALNLSENYAPALVNRGNLYINSQRFEMAETDYKQALEADPTNVDAMIGLAAVLRRTGRHTAARETLLRVLDLDADNPNARFNLAILMRENIKDEGLALRYFNEVTQSERASQGLKDLAKAAIEEIRSL